MPFDVYNVWHERPEKVVRKAQTILNALPPMSNNVCGHNNLLWNFIRPIIVFGKISANCWIDAECDGKRVGCANESVRTSRPRLSETHQKFAKFFTFVVQNMIRFIWPMLHDYVCRNKLFVINDCGWSVSEQSHRIEYDSVVSASMCVCVDVSKYIILCPCIHCLMCIELFK